MRSLYIFLSKNLLSKTEGGRGTKVNIGAIYMIFEAENVTLRSFVSSLFCNYSVDYNHNNLVLI